MKLTLTFSPKANVVGKQNSSNIEKPRHLGTTQYLQQGHFQKSATISQEP